MEMKKKNLKLIGFVVIIALSIISIFQITNVYAAYAYSWTVNGESLIRGSSNQSGNVTWIEDENYSGGVLTLNNYNGGQLKIDCYGTGLGHVFAIKLIGDNKITVENGVGIIANAPIVFIGDGKLTINASVPIGSGSIVNNDSTITDIENTKWNIGTTITIEPTTNNDNSNVIDEDNNNAESNELRANNDEEDNKEENFKDKNILFDNSLINIIILSYCAISLIIIIILIIKLKSSKKNL